MTKIISKFGMGRICLISFILLCCVFTSENAFSIQFDKRCAKVAYIPNDNSIIFSFLFHIFSLEPKENANLDWCVFSYSVGNKPYTNLITFKARNQKSADRVSILIRNKRIGKSIQYFTAQSPTSGTKLPEVKDITVEVDARKIATGPNEVPHKIAYLTLKWSLHKVVKRVISIKIVGSWCANVNGQSNSINLVYELDNIKSNTNTNTMTNTTSKLKSGISNNLEVTGETDAINVTGAEPGENIKIYTVSGVMVKSVAANDDVVNIKLPRNQIYIVKAGQTHYKVAL